MEYVNASDTIKRRLANNCICPLCGNAIDRYSSFEYMAYNIGKSKHYTFFHTKCLLSAHQKEADRNAKIKD